MKTGQVILVAGLAALSACNRSQTQEPAVQANATVPLAPAAPPAPAPPTAPPSATQSLSPPSSSPPMANAASSATAQDEAADPKSVAAALDVARQFTSLLSQGKFDQAYVMLGGRGGYASPADFKRTFAPYSGLSVVLQDTPAPKPEGAAGSIYLSVPLELIGSVGGRHVEHAATLTMRRVNDVPGSSEAQRRWHVDHFDDKVD